MLLRSSATVEPMRSAARRSGPDTAASVRAAASASTLASTSGITMISRTRSMSGAESPVPHGTEAHEAETRSAERESRLSELLDPALRLGLPVRLLVGGPQMPKTARPAAASLSPSRGSYRGRSDVRVHRPIAPGRSWPPVPCESFHPSVPTFRNLASHPPGRLRGRPIQPGNHAGSIAHHTVSNWRSQGRGILRTYWYLLAAIQ